MTKKNILRVVVLIGILSLFTALFSGCSAPKYKVDYDGGKIFYEGAQDFYPAGAQVELICTLMPSDIDISFYLNGEYLNAKYDGQKGYLLRFTMPEEDVLLECRIRESMTYVEPAEPGVLLVDYYREGTVGGDGYYELVLSTTTDPNQYQIDQYRKEEGGEETRVSYLLPFDIQGDYLEIVEEYGMREWENEETPVTLDGVLIVCKFRDGEETIRVSSDQMPENGEEGLQKIRELLEECMWEERIISDEMREETER